MRPCMYTLCGVYSVEGGGKGCCYSQCRINCDNNIVAFSTLTTTGTTLNSRIIYLARKKAKKDMAAATDPLVKAVQNGRQLALKVFFSEHVSVPHGMQGNISVH